jgi:hypothetical protein
MNQPPSNRATLTADHLTAPAPAKLPLLPIELLDACGNGYTAVDLARVLAANARATAALEAA